MNLSNNFFGQHLFSQVTKLCTRSILNPVFQGSKANRYYKKLKCYELLMGMLYCVLSGCTTLREIEAGLAVADGKLRHLGLDYVPPRSTLSDGNKNRPSDVFKSVYEHLYKTYKPSLSDSTLPKAILQKLFLLDSTVFGLFKAILKTSGRHSMNGKKKRGIKKNTVIEGLTLMPSFIEFNAAADHDQQVFKALKLPHGSFVVFDKGYNNYRQFADFNESGITFITRQKENAVYKSLIECIHDNSSANEILKEEIIEVNYIHESGQACKLKLRRIAWWDKPGQRAYEFITNDFELDATIIAQLYRYRWQIELFFKKLKQNFPLQYFVEDNQNAIEIQIWCSLIALLLTSVLHSQHKSKMAFSVFITVLRLHLFNYISLSDLLQFYEQKRGKRKKKTTAPDLFSSA